LLFFPLLGYAQTREPWIDLPPAQWPTIGLINEVQYKNGDRYIDPSFRYAGTGFLINTGTDTLAATAKHILWVAKNKQSSGVSINAQLQQWTMRPKGNTRDLAIMNQLLNEDPNEKLEGAGSSITERDWIVFSVKKSSPNLYPLKPRFTAGPISSRFSGFADKQIVHFFDFVRKTSKGIFIWEQSCQPQHIHGCSVQESRYSSLRWVSDSHFIFFKNGILHPMQFILYTPMSSDSPGDYLYRVERFTQNVKAELLVRLSFPKTPSSYFHQASNAMPNLGQLRFILK
jgi:hypothetical protein